MRSDDASYGVIAKLERATVHIREVFLAAGEAARQTKAKIAIVDDPTSGYREFRLHSVYVPQFPPALSLAMGDGIHNLRSALDHLICALVLANGNKIARDTMFPIAKDAATYQKVRSGRMAGVSAEAMRRIDALAPYAGGAGDGLWELHDLDITDKHKLLLPAVSASTTVVLDMRRTILKLREQREHENDGNPWFPDMVAFELPLKAADPTRLEDGGVVLRVPMGDTSHDDARARLSLVLDRDGELDDEPVDEKLARLSRISRETYFKFVDLL